MRLLSSSLVIPKKIPLILIIIFICFFSQPALSFELGFGFRSLGLNVEVGHKFSDNFNARLSISNYDFQSSNNATQSEVSTFTELFFEDYVNIDFEQLSALIDYHPWQGNFRFTGGVTDNKMLFSFVNLGDDKFIINDLVFSDTVVDYTKYKLQLTNGVSPYLGIGWSTGFDKDKGFSFSGDLGFYYSVNFDARFTAKCSDRATRLECIWVKASAKRENINLKQDMKSLLLPMFGMGLAYKF